MVNPTNIGYDFSWESQGNANPAWRCVTQRGMILAGKRGEMVFEYTPDDMETAEVYDRRTLVFVLGEKLRKYEEFTNITILTRSMFIYEVCIIKQNKH